MFWIVQWERIIVKYFQLIVLPWVSYIGWSTQTQLTALAHGFNPKDPMSRLEPWWWPGGCLGGDTWRLESECSLLNKTISNNDSFLCMIDEWEIELLASSMLFADAHLFPHWPRENCCMEKPSSNQEKRMSIFDPCQKSCMPRWHKPSPLATQLARGENCRCSDWKNSTSVVLQWQLAPVISESYSWFIQKAFFLLFGMWICFHRLERDGFLNRPYPQCWVIRESRGGWGDHSGWQSITCYDLVNFSVTSFSMQHKQAAEWVSWTVRDRKKDVKDKANSEMVITGDSICFLQCLLFFFTFIILIIMVATLDLHFPTLIFLSMWWQKRLLIMLTSPMPHVPITCFHSRPTLK